jgi:hypothetical protein
MNWKNIMRFIAYLLIIFVTGCSARKSLTVAEVIQNAEVLEGKTVRVRGVAYIWVDPTRDEMWMFGGCAPNSAAASSSSQGNVVGWLTLYEQIDPDDLKNYGVPHAGQGIKISESNFHCEGNYCILTCSPFQISSHQMYEFVGTLQVNKNDGMILENMDLDHSSQLVDGEWLPIPGGDFDLMFP